MLYHECRQKWASKFNKIQYQYVPRMQNQIADTLATMTSMMDGPKENEARPIMVEQKEEPAYCMTIGEDDIPQSLNSLQFIGCKIGPGTKIKAANPSADIMNG